MKQPNSGKELLALAAVVVLIVATVGIVIWMVLEGGAR